MDFIRVEWHRIRPVRFLAASIAAAACAEVITVGSPAQDRGTAASIADASAMQMLRDEHALVVAEASRFTETMRLSNRAADDEVSRMKVLASREAAQRVAAAQAEPSPESPTASAASAKSSHRARIERVAYVAEPALQEPLSLRPATLLPRQEEGAIRSRMRTMVSGVTRIPGWFSDAAGWFAELPRKAMPDRRFFTVSL